MSSQAPLGQAGDGEFGNLVLIISWAIGLSLAFARGLASHKGWPQAWPFAAGRLIDGAAGSEIEHYV